MGALVLNAHLKWKPMRHSYANFNRVSSLSFHRTSTSWHSTPLPRAAMARPKITLDDWRGQIEQWVRDGTRREEIQKRLLEQANIRIGASTLSTQLHAWNVRYNRTPIKKTDALRSRVAQLFHERPGLKDEETVRVLQEEGFQISGTRALARFRKERGLFKRVEEGREQVVREDVVQALRREFGKKFEMPEGMGTRELAGFLRGRYNVVGR